ncbi:hypothetical protein Tco_1040123 [Tanacetum coccineum]
MSVIDDGVLMLNPDMKTRRGKRFPFFFFFFLEKVLQGRAYKIDVPNSKGSLFTPVVFQGNCTLGIFNQLPEVQRKGICEEGRVRNSRPKLLLNFRLKEKSPAENTYFRGCFSRSYRNSRSGAQDEGQAGPGPRNLTSVDDESEDFDVRYGSGGQIKGRLGFWHKTGASICPKLLTPPPRPLQSIREGQSTSTAGPKFLKRQSWWKPSLKIAGTLELLGLFPSLLILTMPKKSGLSAIKARHHAPPRKTLLLAKRAIWRYLGLVLQTTRTHSSGTSRLERMHSKSLKCFILDVFSSTIFQMERVPHNFSPHQEDDYNPLRYNAEYYPDVGLEELVPDQFWIEEECKYDIAAIYVLFNRHGYNYMKKIVLRRADLKEYVIAERDFKYMYPSDFEDLYLLNLQGHSEPTFPKTKKDSNYCCQPMEQKLGYQGQRVEKDFQLGIESYQDAVNLTQTYDGEELEFVDFNTRFKLVKIDLKDKSDLGSTNLC